LTYVLLVSPAPITLKIFFGDEMASADEEVEEA
jgi:hypothetical protein